MEPMALGTPSNSGPSSPVTPGGSSYLPSFLLGEPNHPIQASTSPKLKRNGLSDPNLFNSPRNNYPHMTVRNHQVINVPTERSHGPPIKGLFDTLNTPSLESPQPSESSQYISFLSKNQHDTSVAPEYQLDSTWVTVFGYPPAAASYILGQISHCGHVVTTRVPPTGNWMHVLFSTKLEVKRALMNNGKVFSGSVMIGVIPCRDQSILASTKDQERGSLNQSNSLYPNLSPLSENSSYVTSPQRITKARSLVSMHDNEVFTEIKTPQKNTGLVSKAMEYVFGW